MLKIRDLLNIKAIEGVEIVAGEQGLDNEIALVNIIENPDKFDWLSSREFLLSTGFIFKDNIELQNRIVRELAEINCAGLAIKLKRYFDEIPQNMIDLANELGLPILSIPYEYTLSTVISIFNEKSSGSYDSLNRKTLDMHNSLFEIALKGGGVELIAEKLTQTIGNPVLFFDKHWRLLYHNEHIDNKILLSKQFNLIQNNLIFSNDFIESVPNDINEMKKSIKRIYKTKDGEVKCHIFTVTLSSSISGYIVVWQTVRELTEIDYIALEQATPILALEWLKKKEIENVKQNIKFDFFDDLLAGNITSTETIHSLCSLHGLTPGSRYFCIVMSVESDEFDNYTDIIQRKYSLESTMKQCVNYVYKLSYLIDGEITSFYRRNKVITLIGQGYNKNTITPYEMKSFANEIKELINSELKNVETIIGIGNQYNSIELVHRSFSEANEAIRFIEQFADYDKIAHFDDHLIYHFLDANVKQDELEKMFTNCLGVLLEHDLKNETSYLNTLEHYFHNLMNISETAKSMYLHRNTLIYRIEKIKEILNSDLKDAEELFKIQLALKIFKLLKKEEEIELHN